MKISNFNLKIKTRMGENISGLSLVLTAISIGLGFLTLAVAVLSIEHAEWSNPQPSLMLTLFLATIAGVILANLRIPQRLVVFFLTGAGLLFAIWQSVTLFKPTEGLSAFQVWQQTISGNLPSENFVYFSMFLIYITWLIGGFSIWAVVRFRNAWIGIIAGTAMLLINLNNLPRENYSYFVYFFILAISFLGMTHLVKTNLLSITWQQHKFTRGGFIYFSTAVILIIVAIVITAYSFPIPAINNVGVKIDTSSIGGIKDQKHSINFFQSITSKWRTAKSDEHSKLLFKDLLDTSNKIDFVITSGGSDYWCARRYDTYQSWGWSSAAENETTLSAGVHIDYFDELTSPKAVNYVVENRKRTDVILARGNVVSADITINVLTFGPNTNGNLLDNPDIAALSTVQIMRPYQTYKILSNLENVTPEELAKAGTDYPAWVSARYLQVPINQPRILNISRRTTERAKTPYDKVLSVKNYLQTFTYDPSATPPPESFDGVDYFLFTSKKGVCTNFASAMVLMLRESGVPARLCTGYLSGEPDKANGTYIIRGKNTHAWVEVFFPKYGWVTVEATPASGPVNNSQPAVSDTTENDLALAQNSPLPWWMESDIVPPEDAASENAGSNYPATNFPLKPLISIIILISAYLISRWFFTRWFNQMKSVDSPYQAYDRMGDLARMGEFGPKSSETPLEFSHRLMDYLPEEKNDIDIIVSLYNETRYGSEKNVPDYKITRLQTTWVRLSSNLFKRALRLKKWFPIRYLLARWVD